MEHTWWYQGYGIPWPLIARPTMGQGRGRPGIDYSLELTMLDSTGGSSSDQPEGAAADQREQSKTDQPDKETSDRSADDQPGTDSKDNSAAQPDKKDLEGTTCDQPDDQKPLEEDAKPDVEEPMAKKQKVGHAVA